MGIFHFESLLLSVVIFITSGLVVFWAGTKLSDFADAFAEKTGVGRALLGILLLGGITSLPEVVTTITASVSNNAGLAISNILGGVSMQVTILAVVDLWQRNNALSSNTKNVVVIMQGTMLILLLALCGIFMLTPSFAIFHIGINSILLFIFFLGSLYFSSAYSSIDWFSYSRSDIEQLKGNIQSLTAQIKQLQQEKEGTEFSSKPSVISYLKSKWYYLLFLTLAIALGGYFVVLSSEAIAGRLGLSNNFAGFVLVAITTSLPEISTVVGSLRLKKYDMAFSNIFGTNLFDVALIFVADVFYLPGAVLQNADDFTIMAAFLGVILTSFYLLGILIRSKKSLFGLGYDSLLILIIYCLVITMLFFTNGGS